MINDETTQISAVPHHLLVCVKHFKEEALLSTIVCFSITLALVY